MSKITLDELPKETVDFVIEYLKEKQKHHHPVITNWGITDGYAYIEFRVNPVRIKIKELTEEGLNEAMEKGLESMVSRSVP